MIAILLPVLGRPQQIKEVLASLAANTSNPYRALLICSPDDPVLSVALNTNADIVVAQWQPGRSDYAKKLGLGVRSTHEPWLFQGATDLRFYPDWDTNALKAARRHHKGVVGTNDLGNPLVKRGVHSTHSLIARDYLDRYGGTADNTGVIFSEAYDHQWTDSEFIETARRRKQFVFARDSIVEHLHPHWGKGETDATYKKALRSTQQDQRLFMERRQKIARLK